MGQVNELFRKRIGFPANDTVTFERVADILDRTAKSIPFENSSVLDTQLREITKESITDKILIRKEGGVCYELNVALYLFLAENDLDVHLVRGVIFNQGWSPTGRTHVAILLTHENQTYLVDTGFGGNLPLKPVPLSGETIISSNGEFRVKNLASEHGDYVLELKLKHKDTKWKIGYAFDTEK